jgi:hypothetical protein
VGLCAEKAGEAVARVVDGGAGFAAGGVDAGGVAEVAPEVGLHCLEDFGGEGGCGVVVEVDHGGRRKAG